jgi:hypothetical protein
VPMYPLNQLQPKAVQAHLERLQSTKTPTAVAISIFDVRQPAVWPEHRQEDPVITSHWCLAHFLLDGHHKVCAAANAGLPIRLVSFLCTDVSLASAENVAKLKTLL